MKHEPIRVTHTHDVIRAVHNEEEHKMAEQHQHKENDKPKANDKPFVVKSPAGETHGGQELGGDGVTPKAEWDKKYEAIREAHAAHDEKRRKQAVEDSGVLIGTGKGV